MKAINEFLNAHAIFRFDEFKQFMEHHEKGIAEKNCYITLYNYCKKNQLIHIRKNLYMVANTNPHLNAPISPLLIAGKSTADAVLAYHSALESHGVAYTDFNEQTYLTTHRTNDFAFQDQHYRAIYRPTFTTEGTTEKQCIETITLTGTSIRRTTLERTLVDALDCPDLCGGWEEVIRSLDRVTAFNIEKTINYARSLDQASIIAKLGYFLENQRSEYLSTNQKVLEKLLPFIPKQPYYINRKSSIGRGTYIKKWQIIVPDYLHKRQWEEPEHAIDQ